MEKTSLKITINNIPKAVLNESWEDALRLQKHFFGKVGQQTDEIIIDLEKCAAGKETILNLLATAIAEHMVSNSVKPKGTA